MGQTVAIVGATGAVGHELLAVLEQRSYPVGELRLLASARSAGTTLQFAGGDVVVSELTDAATAGVDLAFLSAGGELSRQWAPRFVAAGAVVVDNSSAFRLDAKVPLVVPEANADALSGHSGIIANPNCTTALLVVVLAPLHRRFNLQRVVVATYQAASGAGARAMAELDRETRVALDGGEPGAEVFPYPLAFNLLPQIDVFEPDGYTREEMKVARETRRILDAPDLAISSTCVRVPVRRAHSEAVWLEAAEAMDPAEVRSLLAAAPGVEVVDDPAALAYPMPADVSGVDPVRVGRIRADCSRPGGIALWLVGDQLRKGAALNAVQIAEALRA